MKRVKNISIIAGFLLTLSSIGSGQSIDERIRTLASENFTERLAAQQSLIKAVEEDPQKVLPPVIRALDRAQDPDLSFRINEIVYSVYRAKIINKPRGFLGIRLASSFLPGAQPGGKLRQVIDVLDIIPDTAASRAALMLRDKILTVDGLSVGPDNPKGSFIDYIYAKPPGAEVTLQIWRFGEEKEITVALGNRPPDLPMRTSLQESAESLYRKWLTAAREAVKQEKPVSFE